MRKTFVVLLVLGSLVFAEGRVSARRIHANQLQLGEHRLTGLVRDRLAELSFEQEFHSTGGAPAEVFYEFALPVEATVTSLDMTMNGQWVTGRVLDRKEAKRTYESIVNRRKDPGLLERIGEGRYRVRVFPLPAKGNLKIRVHFQLLLPFRSGAVQLAYADPVGKASRFTGDVRIESPRTITRLDAPTHAVEVDRPSETAARVVWNDTKPRIELRYADQRDDVTFTLFSSRRAGERGTFLAILQPPVTVAEDEVLPKDVVFVLDESGSMEGDKMREAKRALHAGIDKLRDGDRFNVVGFSSGTEAFRDQLVEVNAATRKAARDWVSRRRAMGGTALDAALHDALRFGSRARLGLVALLTDGLPTVGESDPQRIVQRVRAANGARHRVFVFGVGLDQNARFLDALATSTRAVREDITKAAEVLPAMQRFYTRVERPLMTDLQLETPKGTAALQPHALPDLFAGDEVVVTGRFDQSGPALFKLRGRIGSRQVEHVFEGTLTKDQEIACLPRFWARKQVDALLAAIAAGGDRRELVPAVRRLGQQYSIVTPYTAGLVVEE
ncbi:MAG: VIT domain-containing protein, partial [Planctomycetota bacterium]